MDGWTDVAGAQRRLFDRDRRKKYEESGKGQAKASPSNKSVRLTEGRQCRAPTDIEMSQRLRLLGGAGSSESTLDHAHGNVTGVCVNVCE